MMYMVKHSYLVYIKMYTCLLMVDLSKYLYKLDYIKEHKGEIFKLALGQQSNLIFQVDMYHMDNDH